MRSTETARVGAPAAAVFPLVADLGRYPSWMPLVHAATPSPPGLPGDAVVDAAPAWDVEIRARIGPFARSKRLRMERSELVDERLAVFERAEVDGREHARWVLRVELLPVDGGSATDVTMHLAYEGSLWTGGPLARVFDDQVRRGRDGLAAAVTSDGTARDG